MAISLAASQAPPYGDEASSHTSACRGVARILGKGVLTILYAREARAQILATPTYEMERSKFKLSQRTRSDGS